MPDKSRGEEGRRRGGSVQFVESPTAPMDVPKPPGSSALGHNRSFSSGALMVPGLRTAKSDEAARHVSIVHDPVYGTSTPTGRLRNLASPGTSAPSNRFLPTVSSSIDITSLAGPDMRDGSATVSGGTAYKRSNSVIGLGTLKELVKQESMGGSDEPFNSEMDTHSRTRLAENVWWRSWSIQQRRHDSKLKSIPMLPFMPHAAPIGLTVSTAADALSVEGVEREPSNKRWEEYYQLFLERFAADDYSLPFLSSLSDQKSSKPRGVVADDVDGTQQEAGQEGGEGEEAVGYAIDESVHGGNLFAAIFKSDGPPGFTEPTAQQDFSNYTFPWETARTPGLQSEPQQEGPADTKEPREDGLKHHHMGAEKLPLRKIASGEVMDDLGPLPKGLEQRRSSSSTGGNVDTILKKAFTGFHNSHKFGQDNVSPYLGDDLSVRGNVYFAGGVAPPQQHPYRSRASPSSAVRGRPEGVALKGPLGVAAMVVDGPLLDQLQSQQSRVPLLTRMEDCGMWKRTEQHWLLPAVIAACMGDDVDPDQVVGPLAHALHAYGSPEAAVPVDISMSRDPELDGVELPPLVYDAFQTYVLGEVLVCSSALLGHGDFRKLPQKWEVRLLVVKQNYLLEYLPGEPKTPVGYLHLQGSSTSPRLDNRSVLHLTCLPPDASATGRSSSPDMLAFGHQTVSTSKFHHSTTLLHARSASQAVRWISLLEAAAKVRVEDLFEYVPHKGGGEVLTGASLVKASELGRGRFAVVRKARRKRLCSGGDDGEKGRGDAVCALKVVNKAAFWQRVAEGKERHDTLVREVLAQALLTSQCAAGAQGQGEECPIVRLFSAFETADSVILELELMSRNDLFDELSTSGVLKEHKTAHIVNQIVKAVAFCHEHGIAHRDVKLSNIIFPPESPDGSPQGSAPQVKLADFGMAGFFAKSGTLRGRCGTPGYVAPEILCAGVNEGYGNNVDIFSVGVVAYTLLCGYEPFYGVTDKQLIAANKLAEYEFHDPEWTRISADAKDLVSRMLVRDPGKRITPKQALEHSWLDRFNKPLVGPMTSSPSCPAVSRSCVATQPYLSPSGYPLSSDCVGVGVSHNVPHSSHAGGAHISSTSPTSSEQKCDESQLSNSPCTVM